MPSPSLLRLAPLALTAGLLVAGCAGEDEPGPATADESDLVDVERSGGKSQKWIYQGPLPALEAPAVVASLKGHTARVTGLLPEGFEGPLPFWALPTTEEETGRTRITVVYPIATGAVDPSTGVAPAGPGHYGSLLGVAYTPTNEKASWGGFPFFKYHRTRGLAFHGPITSVRNAETGDWEWLLKRGPVSHGCNRMQGEHVVELMHLLGVDMRRPHSSSTAITLQVPVDVITEWDAVGDQLVDVDYPALAAVRRPSGNVAMFPTWDSRDLPQIVCAYDPERPLDGHHCDGLGVPLRDMLTGERTVEADERPWLGTACTSDSDCGFKADGKRSTCFLNADGDAGYCSVPCEGTCPDRVGAAPSFCGTVTVRGELAGTCMAKADPLNEGCATVTGTTAKQVERFVGDSDAQARVATACSF